MMAVMTTWAYEVVNSASERRRRGQHIFTYYLENNHYCKGEIDCSVSADYSATSRGNFERHCRDQELDIRTIIFKIPLLKIC